jgi:hypothetical protein
MTIHDERINIIAGSRGDEVEEYKKVRINYKHLNMKKRMLMIMTTEFKQMMKKV